MKKPFIIGDYTRVYKPSGDVYIGYDSLCFKAGTRYESWIPNDFTAVQTSDGRWHMIGITHPSPPDFIDGTHYNPATVHDAEWQLFHAVSGDLLSEPFADEVKLLCAHQREGERRDIYAPHIVKRGSLYYMFYGPGPIRLAVSEDLYNWELKGAMFDCHVSARDPHILPYGGGYRITYISEDSLLGRWSPDLLSWGDAECVFTMPREGMPESPFILPYDGIYYLFWCIYDGKNGCYDSNTYVYASDTPESFSHDNCVTHLRAHAPEIVALGGEHYILSAEYPNRGINLAKLGWE